MNKADFVNLMKVYGDACVHYSSPISNKEKYVVGTMDFSPLYISEKLKHLRPPSPEELEKSVLMFCWDSDSFKLMKTEQVSKVIPLSELVPNDPV